MFDKLRERQIKAWTRAKRLALIEAVNPAWDDLASGWELPTLGTPPEFGTDPSLRSG
jgi:hypothetical protein